ncbi:MAG TPA: hypothetical protein V6D27_01215 [Vampirovibrionales bacterium]
MSYEQGYKDGQKGQQPKQNQGSEYAKGYARGIVEACEKIRNYHYTPDGYWDLDGTGAF